MNKEIDKLNQSLKAPEELGGRFLPEGYDPKFDTVFIGEMPSMNTPRNWDGKTNYNFNVTIRDRFFQEMMIKYGVAGSYATGIVKQVNKPGQPTKDQIKEWTPFLLKEIEIINPKHIVVLGRRTYYNSFKLYIEPMIIKNINIDYVFHYCTQVTKNKFEQKFKEVINRNNFNI